MGFFYNNITNFKLNKYNRIIMNLEEQINIIEELVDGVNELGEFQDGWDEDLDKGIELLKYLESKLNKD